MAIEKIAGASSQTSEQNIKALLKQADLQERTHVLNLTRSFGKEAIVVLATGPRAKKLRALLEACD